LRNLTPLTGRNAPYRHYLPIPDCGNSTAATACAQQAFVALVGQRAIAP
jgi:hypothetical protein